MLDLVSRHSQPFAPDGLRRRVSLTPVNGSPDTRICFDRVCVQGLGDASEVVRYPYHGEKLWNCASSSPR